MTRPSIVGFEIIIIVSDSQTNGDYWRLPKMILDIII